MALGGKGSGGGGASDKAIKAGEAFFEISGNDQKLRMLLNKNIDRIKQFGKTVRNIGIGIAGVGGVVLAPLTALFTGALDKAGDIQKLANQLNSTAESVSRVGYAATQSGVEIDTFVDASKKMNQAAFNAAKGGVDQSIAFMKMGISAADFMKLPLEEKFLLVAKTLEETQNPLEQTQILTGLFGDEFAKLLPIFKNGQAGLKAFLAESDKVGATLNSQDTKNAVELNRELSKVWTALKSVAYEVGIAVIGFKDNVKDASSTIINIIQNVRDLIRSNRELITIIALVAAGTVAAGAALATFGFAITGMIAGLAALKGIAITVLAVVFSPLAIKIAIVSAAIAGLTALVLGFIDTQGTLKSQFISAWQGILSTFQTTFGGILDALKKGDLALAGQIAITGLQAAWQEGMNYLTEVWVKFKAFFVDGFRDAVMLVRKIWNDVYSWLLDKTVAVIGSILSAIGQVTDYLGVTDNLAKEAENIRAEARKSVEQERQAREQDIFKRRQQQQEEADAFRKGQLQEGNDKLSELKKRLGELVGQAAEKPPEMPTPEKEEQKRKAMENRLGDSVKGLFQSSDYRGALGLGKANDYAKKSYETQKAALEQLVQINRKIDVQKFE